MRDALIVAITFVLTNLMAVGALILTNILPQNIVTVADLFLNLASIFLVYDGFRDANEFEAITGFILMGVCAVVNSYLLLNYFGI